MGVPLILLRAGGAMEGPVLLAFVAIGESLIFV